MAEAVSLEIAAAEIDAWLDYKKVSATKRENRKDQIKTLVEAVSEGDLIINEDKTMSQKLKFPEVFATALDNDSLVYKPRIAAATIHMHLQNVKSDDPDGRLTAHIAALTGKSKEMIKKLDTEDYATAQAIAFFFL